MRGRAKRNNNPKSNARMKEEVMLHHGGGMQHVLHKFLPMISFVLAPLERHVTVRQMNLSSPGTGSKDIFSYIYVFD